MSVSLPPFVPRPLDIYGFSTNIDDLGGKSRYSRNILQWSKNSTNGDYYYVLSLMVLLGL